MVVRAYFLLLSCLTNDSQYKVCEFHPFSSQIGPVPHGEILGHKNPLSNNSCS
jgi:hypothetical protein